MIAHKESITLKEKFPWLTSGYLSSLWLKTSTVLFICNVHVFTWFVFGFGFISECMYVVWFCFWFCLFVIFLNDLVEQFFKWAGRAILGTVCNKHFYELPLLHRHCVSGFVRKYVLICLCVCTHTHAKYRN